MPDSIIVLANTLLRLNVSGTALSELSPAVCSLQSLVCLFAERSGISQIPAGVKAMKSLEFLRLSNSRLTVVHENIALCSRLRELSLVHNQLSALPVMMGELKRLTDNEFSFFGNPGWSQNSPVNVETLRRSWATTFWQRQLHVYFGPACPVVMLAVLCAARKRRLWLPAEVWLNVFSFTRRADYEVAIWRQQRPVQAESDLPMP